MKTVLPALLAACLATAHAEAGQQIHWPEFTRRMEELNEKANLPAGSGSRSGDIIIVMDCKNGYLTEPDDQEILPGWHGGPTRAESEVPLMFSFNYDGKNGQHSQFVSTAVTQALAEIGAGVRMNRHLTPIVVEMIENNR